jgi:hypothetical protein
MLSGLLEIAAFNTLETGQFSLLMTNSEKHHCNVFHFSMNQM